MIYYVITLTKKGRGDTFERQNRALYHMFSEQVPPWESAIKHSLAKRNQSVPGLNDLRFVFRSPVRLMFSNEAKLMLLVKERNIFVNDREALSSIREYFNASSWWELDIKFPSISCLICQTSLWRVQRPEQPKNVGSASALRGKKLDKQFPSALLQIRCN